MKYQLLSEFNQGATENYRSRKTIFESLEDATDCAIHLARKTGRRYRIVAVVGDVLPPTEARFVTL